MKNESEEEKRGKGGEGREGKEKIREVELGERVRSESSE